jgi:hypothetical protein
MGYVSINNTGAGGLSQEYDTKQCQHCGGIVQIYIKRHIIVGTNARQLRQPKDEGYFCMKCMGPLCKRCGEKAFKTGCMPFMEELLKEQKRKTQKRKLVEMMMV